MGEIIELNKEKVVTDKVEQLIAKCEQMHDLAQEKLKGLDRSHCTFILGRTVYELESDGCDVDIQLAEAAIYLTQAVIRAK